MFLFKMIVIVYYYLECKEGAYTLSSSYVCVNEVNTNWFKTMYHYSSIFLTCSCTGDSKHLAYCGIFRCPIHIQHITGSHFEIRVFKRIPAYYHVLPTLGTENVTTKYGVPSGHFLLS